MKRVKLLLGALLLITSVSAKGKSEKIKVQEQPMVYYIATEDAETFCKFDNPEQARCYIRERNSKRDQLKEEIALEYVESAAGTSQCQSAPLYLFTRPDNKFSFAVGGVMKLTSSYDFKGIVDNIDFITAQIPVPGATNQNQQFLMDASTSKVYFKAIANTSALGQVVMYMDVDMRGGDPARYIPRIRTAYASFLGISFGRNITTFCDLSSIPNTIDYEGPNALSYNYSTQLRYERELINDRLGMGIAIEYPSVSGMYNEQYFTPSPQRVPDVPMYMQVMWGAERQHHFRASAVLRNPYMYDVTQDKNISLFGWGVQGSGNIGVCSWARLLFNGTYGEGISNYIEDLIGSGLDFTPKPNVPTTMQTTPMYAWQAAAELHATDRLCFNGGYSTARIDGKNGYISEDEFKRADYIFGNLFYNVTPRFQVACEYIHGYRQNVNDMDGKANRINLLAAFSF